MKLEAIREDAKAHALETLLEAVMRNRPAGAARARSGVCIGDLSDALTPVIARFCERAVQIEPPVVPRYFKEHREDIDFVAWLESLEYIADDRVALQQTHQVLRSGGTLVISSAASRSLWSSRDVVAKRQRRYERDELVAKLQSCGFQVERATYFFKAIAPWERLALRATDFLGSHPAQLTDSSASAGLVHRLQSLWVERASEREVVLLRRADLDSGTHFFCVARKNS
jgi:hypothetical protein